MSCDTVGQTEIVGVYTDVVETGRGPAPPLYREVQEDVPGIETDDESHTHRNGGTGRHPGSVETLYDANPNSLINPNV